MSAVTDPRLSNPRQAPRRTVRIAWSDPRFRNIVWQVLVVGGVALALWYLIGNVTRNLAARHIAGGFGFLGRTAGIPIAEPLIPYDVSTSSNFRALVEGLLNTLRVSVLGIVLATILGTVVGVVRLSPNWLAARIAAVYVEVTRDIPPLLQLLFWYLVLQRLPAPRKALHLAGAVLSNRGIRVPWVVWTPAHDWALLVCVAGIVATFFYAGWAERRQMATGRRPLVWPVALALIVGLPVLVWAALGAPTAIDLPTLHGFNFSGGVLISPEFTALLVGLTIYTAAYIAEVVRSGIEAVPQGQWEAAGALGLHRGRMMRLIVLPQALRVIIPPLVSEYLNLTKNSSLAVAIGFQEIVVIATTVLNQTGQAVEGMFIIMVVYLTISLSISGVLNWYNARIALVSR
jgi:general L-amino acid transport system permease protein